MKNMNGRILFTGDCRFDGQYRKGVRDLFDLFPNYDLYVINFESAIQMNLSVPLAQKSVTIAASVEDVEHLLSCVEPHRLLLNFANNHSRDAGAKNLFEAKHWLCNQGVHVIDCGESVRLELNEQTFVFHAFGQTTWRTAAEKVSKAEGAHDVVLAHWGEEYVFQPHPAQRLLAGILARTGVDCIVGSHPHVLQGHERIDQCVIFYSLGNTVFGFPGMVDEGLLGSVLSAEFIPEGLNAEIYPLKIQKNGGIVRLFRHAATDFEKLKKELDNSVCLSEWDWCREAAVPFFKNHLESWRKRIDAYGCKEVVFFLRTCCSHAYLKMFRGLVAGGWLVTRRSKLAHLLQTVLNDD